MQTNSELSIVSRRTWLALVVGIFAVTCLPAVVATDTAPAAQQTSRRAPAHALTEQHAEPAALSRLSQSSPPSERLAGR